MVYFCWKKTIKKEEIIMADDKYTSIVNLDFQYAHRFMNWPCKLQ